MASAAQQLASNFNLGAFAKATELKKRLWFTLGALVIYRLGTWDFPKGRVEEGETPFEDAQG